MHDNTECCNAVDETSEIAPISSQAEPAYHQLLSPSKKWKIDFDYTSNIDMVKVLTYVKTSTDKWKKSVYPQESIQTHFLVSMSNGTVYDKLRWFKKLTDQKRSLFEKYRQIHPIIGKKSETKRNVFPILTFSFRLFNLIKWSKNRF